MKELLELSVDDFESLQASGVLYKLYPHAPINMPMFIAMKDEYDLNVAAFDFFVSLAALSGVDVEELISLFQEHKESIKFMIENFDHVDIVDLIESVRGELE
jgi:hypothetical protein